MALKFRLDPIAKDLRVMVSGTQDKAQKLVAAFAREQITRADDINRAALGRVPPKRVTVDGRTNAPLESVKPNGGVIIAEWDLFTNVLVWIAQMLRERSPRISGAYIKGHKLLADGAEIAPSTDPPVAQEYVFLNVVPYARKIEIGKTKSGRNFVIQVPNRIYELVAQDARARFGNLADIRFSYRETVGAYQLQRSTGRRRGRRGGDAVSAPAIIVRLRNH